MTTKIPVELSSTPGIVDGSNATAITIDSDEKVGIGVTSPADYYSDQLVVSSPSEGGITLASTATSNANYILFADGTSGDAAYRGQVAYNHNNDLMSIVSSGTLDFRTGSSRTERLRILDGGGITFNGDSAAANALDDYEEGTWQAVHGGNNMTGNGYYVKVGGLVHFQGDWTSASGSTQTQIISGLPFNSSTSRGHSSFIVGYTDSGGGHRGGYTQSTSIYLIKTGNVANLLSAGQRVIVQGTYSTVE